MKAKETAAKLKYRCKTSKKDEDKRKAKNARLILLLLDYNVL
jgi:hypothetical protein